MKKNEAAQGVRRWRTLEDKLGKDTVRLVLGLREITPVAVLRMDWRRMRMDDIGRSVRKGFCSRKDEKE